MDIRNSPPEPYRSSADICPLSRNSIIISLMMG